MTSKTLVYVDRKELARQLAAEWNDPERFPDDVKLEFSGATLEQHHEQKPAGWVKELEDILIDICEEYECKELADHLALKNVVRSRLQNLILNERDKAARDAAYGLNHKEWEKAKKEGYQQRDKEVDVSAAFGFEAGVKSERERILAALPLEDDGAPDRSSWSAGWGAYRRAAIEAIRAAIEQKEV